MFEYDALESGHLNLLNVWWKNVFRSVFGSINRKSKKKFLKFFLKFLWIFFSLFFSKKGTVFTQNSVIRFTSNCFLMIRQHVNFSRWRVSWPSNYLVNHAVEKRGFWFFPPTHWLRGRITSNNNLNESWWLTLLRHASTCNYDVIMSHKRRKNENIGFSMAE